MVDLPPMNRFDLLVTKPRCIALTDSALNRHNGGCA
jgi:hypothetical protein